MNTRATIKRISRILLNIPQAHDGMGKTASAKGALAFNADMRTINAMLANLALDCDDLTTAQIDKRLMEIETQALEMKQKALAPD